MLSMLLALLSPPFAHRVTNFAHVITSTRHWYMSVVGGSTSGASDRVRYAESSWCITVAVFIGRVRDMEECFTAS